jgi:peptide/nickel transport system substrate-binding protein
MSFRDVLWNYPQTLKNVYDFATPFSHALVILALGILFFSAIFSDPFSKVLNREKRDGYVEGIVGNIQNLNPLFINTNQVDRDLMELLFTKFIEIDATGNALPALATSWVSTSDSKSFNFKLRQDIVWSDGVPVTADDVLFTFEFSKELNKKYGIDTFGSSISTVEISKVNDYEVKFLLPEVNATFLETISVYIVPKHILQNTTIDSYIFTQFAKYPTGSGPFMIDTVSNSSVLLTKNPHFNKQPILKSIEFKLFNNLKDLELAFKSNKIDGMGTFKSGNFEYFKEYEKNYDKYSFNMPFRKKIIFFNTRLPKYSNSTIRKGITSLINIDELLRDLKIDGKVSDGPLPSTSWAYVSNLNSTKFNVKDAEVELKLAGYTKNPSNGFYTSTDGKILSLDITYLENEFNTNLVNYLIKKLEAQGILLNGVPKDYDQLTREVLASRDFELILYDLEVSIDPDQYNIWHSLKIDYPNLNISGYKFNRVDIYLERGRQVLNKGVRLENYLNFQKVLLADTPAIFLYEPKYTFIIRNEIDGFSGKNISYPQQRFKEIVNWKFK